MREMQIQKKQKSFGNLSLLVIVYDVHNTYIKLTPYFIKTHFCKFAPYLVATLSETLPDCVSSTEHWHFFLSKRSCVCVHISQRSLFVYSIYLYYS